MDPARQISTDFLVLRKTPFSETSLVVAGIAPELGQVHFLVRGARRLGKRQYPLVDLFRLLHVRCRATSAELHHWQAADLVRDFGAVARDVGTFRTAAWLARFALANVPEGMPSPRFFHAMLTALQRLADASATPPAAVCISHAAVLGACLTFLDESGVLPDYRDEPETARRCRLLLSMGLGENGVPELSQQTWEQLRRWVESILRWAEYTVPD